MKIPVCIHTWIEPEGEQYIYPQEISADEILAMMNAFSLLRHNPFHLPSQVKTTETGSLEYEFENI